MALGISQNKEFIVNITPVEPIIIYDTKDLNDAIKKGATPEDHVLGGQKAMNAGFQVSEYWMPWESMPLKSAQVPPKVLKKRGVLNFTIKLFYLLTQFLPCPLALYRALSASFKT